MHAQTIVQMVEDKGVYKVPCEINGLKVKMVFDTGAAAVSLSLIPQHFDLTLFISS